MARLPASPPSTAKTACVCGSCRVVPACGADTATTVLPFHCMVFWVHTTGPSNTPRLPELLRWKVVTVPSGLDPMPWATGGVVLHAASSPLTSVRQNRARRPRSGMPLDAARVRGLINTGGTMLGSHNRADPFAYFGADGADCSARALDCLQRHGITPTQHHQLHIYGVRKRQHRDQHHRPQFHHDFSVSVND